MKDEPTSDPRGARTPPACVLTPETDEGPYFVDERLLRSDVRVDPSDGSRQDGVPLRLDLQVVRADGGCEPVADAYVDIWHCNSEGVYSDERAEETLGKKFLRGCQKTDAAGRVRFETIVPGWYSGRSVHVHVKIRSFRDDARTYEFTSQLFFDDTLIREIHTSRDPYAARGAPELTNADDPVFGDDGWRLVLPLSPDDGGGFETSMTIGLANIRPTV